MISGLTFYDLNCSMVYKCVCFGFKKTQVNIRLFTIIFFKKLPGAVYHFTVNFFFFLQKIF